MLSREQFNEFQYNVLGKDSSFNGELSVTGPTTILSRFEGTLSVTDESKVTLERGSYFEGNLNCCEVEIFSEFKGILNAKKRVIIRSSANVSGSIFCENLIIYPGALVNISGETNHNEESPKVN